MDERNEVVAAPVDRVCSAAALRGPLVYYRDRGQMEIAKLWAEDRGRLGRFIVGAMRAIKDHNRIVYGWNGEQYGYYTRDDVGDIHWAGTTIEDAVAMLATYAS